VKSLVISVLLLLWQVVQNLNPIWNETFEFKELSGGEHLRLRVFDSDKLNMDQNIGVARVNLLVSTAELMV
jgi:Ca2+-dependent lipid-binding protein